MELDRDLVKQFASVMKPQVDRTNTSTKMYGVVSKIEDGVVYVILDGSELETPAEASVDCKEDDRVIVQIRNHKAYISDNFTAPPSGRVADKYFQFTADGMVIGRIDPETDAPAGNYILITDTEYQIRSENGSVLARYGSGAVHLGYDTSQAIIYLCDDEGRIYYADNTLVLQGDKSTGIRSVRESDDRQAQVAVEASSSQLAAAMSLLTPNGSVGGQIGIRYDSSTGQYIVSVTGSSGSFLTYNNQTVLTSSNLIKIGTARITGNVGPGKARYFSATVTPGSGFTLAGIREVSTNKRTACRITSFGTDHTANRVFANVYNGTVKNETKRVTVSIEWFAFRTGNPETVAPIDIPLPDSEDGDPED